MRYVGSAFGNGTMSPNSKRVRSKPMRKLLVATVILLLQGALVMTAQIQKGRTAVGSGGKIQETTNIINDCESRSNRFKKTLDRALGRDNVRAGQGREDQLNQSASILE